MKNKYTIKIVSNKQADDFTLIYDTDEKCKDAFDKIINVIKDRKRTFIIADNILYRISDISYVGKDMINEI